MSFTLHGIPVSRGIAIGRAYLIAPAALDVAHYLIEAERIEAEIERFRTALGAVRRALDVLRADLTDDTPTEVAAFIDVHAMILGDAMLVQETIDLIRTRRYNVEWALTEQLDVLAGHFDDIEDEYLRERKADIEQVVERVLKALAGAPSPAAARARAGGRGRGGPAPAAPTPAADLVCPLLSLPFALGLEYDAIPSRTPYLDVPDAARRRFRGSLGGQAKRKFGSAWSGSAPVQDNRALPLDALAPLFALAGIDWIVLQPTLSDSEHAALDAHPDAARIHRLEGLTDFAATAALVDRLDGVVAIDTAVAHLAGALGKPLWLMLPVAADWRWSTGDDSAWYPRARLVRQSEPGRWDDVVATVAGEIAHG